MPSTSTLFPYTTLFRSVPVMGISASVITARFTGAAAVEVSRGAPEAHPTDRRSTASVRRAVRFCMDDSGKALDTCGARAFPERSEEHTLNSSHANISYAVNLDTLSLHDALPICPRHGDFGLGDHGAIHRGRGGGGIARCAGGAPDGQEEHGKRAASCAILHG